MSQEAPCLPAARPPTGGWTAARGPPSSRGACDFPLAHRAGTWGGTPPATSGRCLGSPPTLQQARRTTYMGPPLPGSAQDGPGAPRPAQKALSGVPWHLGTGPHTSGALGHAPDDCPPCRGLVTPGTVPPGPHLLQVESPPPSSRCWPEGLALLSKLVRQETPAHAPEQPRGWRRPPGTVFDPQETKPKPIRQNHFVLWC